MEALSGRTLQGVRGLKFVLLVADDGGHDVAPCKGCVD